MSTDNRTDSSGQHKQRAEWTDTMGRSAERVAEVALPSPFLLLFLLLSIFCFFFFFFFSFFPPLQMCCIQVRLSANTRPSLCAAACVVKQPKCWAAGRDGKAVGWPAVATKKDTAVQKNRKWKDCLLGGKKRDIQPPPPPYMQPCLNTSCTKAQSSLACRVTTAWDRVLQTFSTSCLQRVNLRPSLSSRLKALLETIKD